MGVVSVQKYLNMEAGLLYETRFTRPLVMDSCVGKKVKYEQLEHNFVKIDGKYYEIIGWYNGLAHLSRCEDLDVFDKYIGEVRE